ncbi:UDP-glycosyltransferase family 50 member B3 isoform X2 [Bombus vancouverensis nearcticus]|uniref:UDP-glycosyltransferase family 50 member B3 isoform X2 n=1 Tax=Bombus vancouverensis nearcticus TaxID=2705178 RepID=UPI00402B07FC
MSNSMAPTIIFFVILLVCNCTMGYNILLATMGGTKSHTVPFVALGSSLKARGHNVTLLSAFPGPAANSGLQEFVPPIFEAYVGNYTSEWDLVGARFRDEMPISPWDAMRYAWEACEALLRDEISVSWLRRPEGNSQTRWDVAVVDGAFPECLLGVLHGEDVPTIMLNTVALYSGSISRQGNPSPWSVTPYFGKSLTQDMNFFQRVLNVACLVTLRIMHWIMVSGYLQPVLRKYLGNQLPDVRDLTTEIPLTLQNSHYSVAESVPYLANVVNVACLHCKPATKLSPDLESFLQREKLGYVLVMDLARISIGSFRDGILKVAAIHNNSYRMAAKKRSSLLRELPINPRKLATWWVEHVAKYKGAEHLKSSTRYMNVIHYYSIDVAMFYAIALLLSVYGLKKLCWRTISKQIVRKKID